MRAVFGLVAAAAVVLVAATAAPASGSGNSSTTRYEPTWPSLDSRKTPEWFFNNKFYIFIHWGIFSVPAYAPVGAAAEWYKQYLMAGKPEVVEFHRKNYGNASYAEFAEHFHAELWDPTAWTDLFQKAGARGIMFTTKHCDGYTHWKSPTKWNYNSVDVGPHRDVVADLTAAVRQTDLKLGFYYCDCEWGNPLLPWPQPPPKASTEYCSPWPACIEGYVNEVWFPDMQYLTNTYKPDMFFPDFGAPCGFNSTILRSRELLAWLYNDSPVKDTVVIGDRLGSDAFCQHGDYYTCRDRYQPHELQHHNWMDAMTIATSWGLNRLETSLNYQTAEQLIHILIDNVAYGGVLTLNVGPAADGTIIPIQQERLLQMGEWLAVNGEAIYDTAPFRVQNESAVNVFYTAKNTTVYAIITAWPKNTHTIQLQTPKVVSSLSAAILTGPSSSQTLSAQGTVGKTGISFTLPDWSAADMPCQYAWVVRLTGVA